MAFKVKNKPIKKNIDNRVTLDAKHTEKIDSINKQQNLIEINKKELKIINSKYIKLKNKDYKKNIVDILELKDKIIDLEYNIKTLSNNADINYLLDTGYLLFNYYDTIENKNNNNNKNNKTNIKKTTINNKLVSEYFNINPCSKVNSKAQIYDTYLNKLNNSTTKNISNTNIDMCIKCNKEKILFLSDGKMICELCGDENKILIDSDKPSYKDPPREISYFAYKRINHFNEWLAQFQAKESTDIPKEIYDEILIELKKERICNINNLSQQKLREILKKLKKNKY